MASGAVLRNQASSIRRLVTEFSEVRSNRGQTQKTALEGAVFFEYAYSSALASFEPTLRFVDHINAAFATHNTAITVPVLERAERVLDLHGLSPVPAAPCARCGQRLVLRVSRKSETANSWWAIQGSNL